MSITDDERRSAALILREMAELDMSEANPWWYVVKAAHGDVGIHGTSDMFKRLADLIEPAPERTCRDAIPEKYEEPIKGYWECSECGCCCKIGYCDPSNYCPNCGAKVVE